MYNLSSDTKNKLPQILEEIKCQLRGWEIDILLKVGLHENVFWPIRMTAVIHSLLLTPSELRGLTLLLNDKMPQIKAVILLERHKLKQREITGND